jgi:hypothetical protein
MRSKYATNIISQIKPNTSCGRFTASPVLYGTV